MSKIYFIGGTPRTGKTTLTMRFIAKQPILAISADSIRYMLRRLYDPEEQPELFRFAKYISDDPLIQSSIFTDHSKAIDIQNRESAFVWQSIKSIIQSHTEDGIDVLIEGIVVMPMFLDELEYDYRVVYLGNQSESHTRNILEHARLHSDDWMHQLNEETIYAFSKLNISFSKYIEEQASRYNQTYIEMRDDHFETDLDSALHLLLA
jgi:2-phosphoglycerate kinase